MSWLCLQAPARLIKPRLAGGVARVRGKEERQRETAKGPDGKTASLAFTEEVAAARSIGKALTASLRIR
jgi:hypothetical protein